MKNNYIADASLLISLKHSHMSLSDSLRAQFESLHENNQHEEILTLAKEQTITPENQIELKTYVGRALNNLGRLKEALTYLLEVDQLEQESNAATKYRIAYAYAFLDQLKEAEAYVAACLALDAEFPYADEITDIIRERKAYLNSFLGSGNVDNSLPDRGRE